MKRRKYAASFTGTDGLRKQSIADPARGGLTAQIIVLGALFQLATLLVFGCVSLLAGRVTGRFNSSVKGQLFLNRAAGCVFTGLAVMLLVSSR